LATALGVKPAVLLDEDPDGPDLRTLRYIRGFSVEQVAVKLHVTAKTIKRWEAGQMERLLPPETLAELARVLQVSAENARAAALRGRMRRRSAGK
jgi:transcriptional regulator with XRE-family HTH domain